MLILSRHHKVVPEEPCPLALKQVLNRDPSAVDRLKWKCLHPELAESLKTWTIFTTESKISCTVNIPWPELLPASIFRSKSR